MDYPRCRTCKHWYFEPETQWSTGTAGELGHGASQPKKHEGKPIPSYRIGCCNHPKMVNGADEFPEADGAATHDMEDYSSAFHPSEGFGCSLHEEGQAETPQERRRRKKQEDEVERGERDKVDVQRGYRMEAVWSPGIGTAVMTKIPIQVGGKKP